MRKRTMFGYLVLTIFIYCTDYGRVPMNKHYPVNRESLLQTSFVKLPLGSIKPRGWLRDQLVAQASGLTGYLDEFWPDLVNSAWQGGDGESWERGPYYLDGLVPLAYLLEDERLIEKTKPWIEWILNSGQPNGWFGPTVNEDRWPLAVALKVLKQYYEATKDERVLEFISAYFSYLLDNPPDWPDHAWRGVRAMENAVTGYWLYRRTGNPDILKVIQSIFDNSFDWPSYFFEFPWDTEALSQNRIPLNWESDGLTAHVVNVAMAIKYPGIWYQQSKDEIHKRSLYEGIKNLDEHHGQVGGRFSGDEHLSGKRPTQGTELCAVVEFMYSLEKLIEVFGDPALADRLELLAYNSLPGTMTPDCWAHQYDQQANQVIVSDAKRQWSTNGNSSNIYGLMPNYPCCLANMHQGWPKFVAHMWMATHDQGLAAIAFGPSEVSAFVGDGVSVKIVEQTEYPFDGKISFALEMSDPAEFPLYARIPKWADRAELSTGVETIATEPGMFVQIKKKWSSGDRVKLSLPMRIRTETRYNDSVSILRGPLYFALRVGKKYRKIHLEGKHICSIDFLGSVDWEILPTTPWNYGLLVDRKNPEHDITVQRHRIAELPFGDKGEFVFSSRESRYVEWPHEAPVVLTLHGRRIPEWGLSDNSADDSPVSPVTSSQETETLCLVPYGCARLRVSEFPVIRTD